MRDPPPHLVDASSAAGAGEGGQEQGFATNDICSGDLELRLRLPSLKYTAEASQGGVDSFAVVGAGAKLEHRSSAARAAKKS